MDLITYIIEFDGGEFKDFTALEDFNFYIDCLEKDGFIKNKDFTLYVKIKI